MVGIGLEINFAVDGEVDRIQGFGGETETGGVDGTEIIEDQAVDILGEGCQLKEGCTG